MQNAKVTAGVRGPTEADASGVVSDELIADAYLTVNDWLVMRVSIQQEDKNRYEPTIWDDRVY